jgi:lipopolysaccharide/colanic/teichoic acid biosynthesis glycosyltransferase
MMASRATISPKLPAVIPTPVRDVVVDFKARRDVRRKFASAVVDESFWIGEAPSKPATAIFAKRALDVILAAIGLAASIPVLAIVAILIKLDSPGPVFYRSPRAGKDGQFFPCYKLRTMKVDADRQKDRLRALNERTGPLFKLTRDPRVTKLGRFLRRYSIDELPQFWNVLRGEMSLVGPRPHPLDDFDRYERRDFRRLLVTPGITGLWQVTARRDPSFQRNMALDLEYIEHGDMWMDLKILWKTVSAVLQGSGV